MCVGALVLLVLPSDPGDSVLSVDVVLLVLLGVVCVAVVVVRVVVVVVVRAVLLLLLVPAVVADVGSRQAPSFAPLQPVRTSGSEQFAHGAQGWLLLVFLNVPGSQGMQSPRLSGPQLSGQLPAGHRRHRSHTPVEAFPQPTRR